MFITPQTVLWCSSRFYPLAHHLRDLPTPLLPLSNILNTFPNVHYTLYADDIELHSEPTNYSELQLCMDTIHNWLTCNHLQFNATKTDLLNINSNFNLDNFPILYIHSSPLTPSSTVNYLRITLNPTLYSDDISPH